MRHYQTFPIPLHIIEDIQNDNLESFSTEILSKGLLDGLLSKTMMDFRENLIDNSIKIILLEVDASDGDGCVEVDYMGSVYMGCRDQDYNSERNDTVDILVDFDEKQATFSMEIPEERNTHEEF